jgi:hypothetical protein
MAYTLDGRTLRPGSPFVGTDGTQYPGNWLTLSSDAEKEAIGIVITSDPLPFNNKFYFGRNSDGDLIERELVGLQSHFRGEQKETAGTLLSKTDWYVTRNAETGDAIPVGVTSFRSEVRTVSGNRETMINATTDVPQLESLVTGAGTSSIVGYTTTLLPEWPRLEDYN